MEGGPGRVLEPQWAEEGTMMEAAGAAREWVVTQENDGGREQVSPCQRSECKYRKRANRQTL